MESDRTPSSSEVSDDAPSRRRGRPIGKHRVPLSLNERRARNAQYERERRYETSEAMAELAHAAKCDRRLNHSNLLATVINHLKRAAENESSSEIEELKRTNEKLTWQVEALEQRLSNWEDSQYSLGNYQKHAKGGKRKGKSNKREKSTKVLKLKAESPLDSDTDSNGKFSNDDDDDEESQNLIRF
ncbi:uncharacterized protein LOC123875162 [Maniola jurtina]|uniref:uncharacterized protein LOC123875162 n=1 Tax=Maniola jurtina TaxID=191418 RepID=UPI001E68C403|nr:uncharacterized protein LOC123875162 [Maniola jurtina]